MAEQQSRRQGESRQESRYGESRSGESRQSESMIARSGEGERGLSMFQYQDPLALFDSLFDRLKRNFFGTTLFNTVLPELASVGGLGVPRVPRVQVQDAGDAVVLIAELPGINAEDVQIDLSGDVLTLRGETRSREEREDERYSRHMSFYRQLRLPEDADPDQAEASYKNGLLSIRIPKRTQRTNVRQIPITMEGGQQAKEKGRAA